MNTAFNTSSRVEYWYEPCRQQFFAMGVKLGYGNHETDDIISQFFLSLLEKNIDLSGISNPKAYLAVAFKRKLIDYYRKTHPGQFVDTGKLEEELAEPSIQDTLEQLQSNKELIQKIRAAYKKIPLRCQKVIYLKFYKGLTTDQIAEQTGLSKRSVYNNLFEGVKLLRSELKREYPSVQIAAFLSALPLIPTANFFFENL